MTHVKPAPTRTSHKGLWDAKRSMDRDPKTNPKVVSIPQKSHKRFDECIGWLGCS